MTNLLHSLEVCLFLLLSLKIYSEANLASYQVRFPKPKGTYPYAKPSTTLAEDLLETTVCFWARPNHESNEPGIFSYATESQDNEFLIMLELQKVKYVGIELYRRTTSYNNNSFLVNTNIQTGQWLHVCVTWSSYLGKWELYVNGLSSGSGTGMLPGESIASGGIIIIGQDQDSLGGDFQDENAYRGELTKLHMWDRVLEPCEVASLANCSSTEEGNIISWSRTWMGLYNGAEIGPVALPCQRETSCKSHESMTPL